MSSIEYHLRYYSAGLAELEDYLLSQEMYWPVGKSPPAGDPPYPYLTLGNILLARARLRSRSQSFEADHEFLQLEREMEVIRSHWQIAWEQKATREFHARLNLWRDFLEEYRRDPAGNIDRYAYEVHRRVELELLRAESGSIPSQELVLLTSLDKLLQGVFHSGGFIWDTDLSRGFPQEIYWHLYGFPMTS